jgi:hypothetical protein
MTSTEIVHRNVGGRPLSANERRKRLRVDILNRIGVENLSAFKSEQILAATELTVMAWQARQDINRRGKTSAAELASLVKLENAVARAQRRLGLCADDADDADV